MSVRVFGPENPPEAMGRAERWLRVGAWFVALVAISLWCELVGNVWCLWLTRRRSRTRVRRSNWLVRLWGCSLFDLVVSWLRVRVTVHGEAPPGRFVVVGNHQSTADISVFIRALAPLNCKYVAKRELGWGLPAVSVALARAGGALVTRRASRGDIRRLRAMAAGLEHWEGSAVLFAEGSRSRDGRVHEYRPGAVRLVAEEARLPLLPVAIDGTHAAADLPGFVRHMPGMRMGVWIGEPIAVERWEGRLGEVLDEIRAWTIDRLEEGRLTGTVRPPHGWTAGTTGADDAVV